MAYTTIDDPSQHFDILTRSGVYDSSGTYDLTGLNFQPDFVWEKVRSVSGDHYLQNSSLTGKKMLKSNSSADENTDGNIESYLSNGIQINRQYDWNSSRTLVDWFWKANGGTTSSNSDGGITTTVQANTTAGFSIITYEGTFSSTSIGHGLNSAPEWLIFKNRESTDPWALWHVGLNFPTDDLIYFNANAANQHDPSFLNTAPSSSVITLGAYENTNQDNNDLVCYAFHSIKGYSKFGSYTGNGNADGAFVYTGFKPAWLMWKRTDSGTDWRIFDNKRDDDNVVKGRLFPNTNDSENTSQDTLDFLSNGFKLRSTNSGGNASGGTYIYMAFAEHPFVSSKGVPVTAR